MFAINVLKEMDMDISWKQKAEQAWDEKAKDWHKRSKDMWESGSRKSIIPLFTKFVPKGLTVCDLGCGDGYGSYLLSINGYDVIGIDLSHEMVDLAKKRERDGLRFVQGDIGKTPFKDDSFDALLAINSIEWTESPNEVLQEWRRLLKTEGYLVVGILGPTAHPRTNSFGRLLGEKVICNTMMPWEFERLATLQGWKKVGEAGVYKRGVTEALVSHLPLELKQALTFMWLFVLQKL
jgi:ubiquinone/menaquinone biosynthesis C-methylase UbiE